MIRAQEKAYIYRYSYTVQYYLTLSMYFCPTDPRNVKNEDENALSNFFVFYLLWYERLV